MNYRIYSGILAASIFLTGFGGGENSMEVTASAFTSTAGETDDTPTLAAWGDTLKPGMKAIAVSRDLIKVGLNHNQMVKISGLDGEYRVLDKMNKRWKRKIDIYMGNNKEKAKKWGKQKVTIYWTNSNP